MTSLARRTKQHSSLFQCLAISLLIHCAALLYFYTHPILVHKTWKSLFGLSSATPELLSYQEENEELEQTDQILEEAFQQVVVLPHHLQSPFDLVELPQGMPLSPSLESSSAMFPPINEWTSLEETHFDTLTQAEDLSFSETIAIEPLFIPGKPHFEIASQLDIDAEPMIAEIDSLPLNFSEETDREDSDLIALSEAPLEALPETDQSGINILDRPLPLALETDDNLRLKTDTRSQLGIIHSQEFATSSPTAVPLFIPQSLPRVPAENREIPVATEPPRFEEYAFPRLTTASPWNDDFEAHLQFFPKEEGKGYTFSVTLTPAFEISQYSLKQNIHFILDRSNSVQRHRFAVFKRAIIKALASMQTPDAFNIYVVDKKIVRLSPTPLKYSAKALRAAEEFLEKQEAGGHFATADIYSSLDQILPEVFYENEVDTAILLTDGNSSLSTSKQQKLLSKWIEKNNGALSLYTAAVGQKNNLILLDLLSSISGGRLLYSDTHASFPRKLAKLILDLRNPIANDMTLCVIPENSHAHIEIHTASNHLPALYCHQPYVVTGTIDEPCNFDLILQGRHGEEWICIKKSLSFTEGIKATRSQAKKWDAQTANLHYAHFLKEGKIDQLKQAKEILRSTRTEIAFD